MTRTVVELIEAVRTLARARPAADEQDIVAEVEFSVTEAERAALVRATLESFLQHVRREGALAVERAAQQERLGQERARRTQRDAERAPLQDPAVKFQMLFDDPGHMYDKAVVPGVWLNARDRKEFRTWCGSRFADWHTRADAVARAGTDSELFAEDWHPRGVWARQHERMAAEMRVLVDRIADTIRLEVTQELLDSEFALGDGRQVRWGSATVAEHEQRIDMLERNAVANAEAAARHRAAIDLLKANGATSLGEIGVAA